jgi:hypothetical protein
LAFEAADEDKADAIIDEWAEIASGVNTAGLEAQAGFLLRYGKVSELISDFAEILAAREALLV